MRDSTMKKIMFTIFVVILIRFCNIIPVPFIDVEQLRANTEMFSSTVFGLFDMISGGSLSEASLFAMGISPYINASIVVQLLTYSIPRLEQFRQEGLVGKKKLDKITYGLACILAVVQAYGFTTLLIRDNMLTRSDVFATIMVIFSFVAGSILTIIAGTQITKHGIGNGTSVILVAGIVSGIPDGILYFFTVNSYLWKTAIVVMVIFLFIMAVVMNGAEQKIPVHYAVASRYGNKQYSYLPLKVNMSGVMPVIFASTILSLPNTILVFFPQFLETGFGMAVQSVFSSHHLIYKVVYLMLILFFNQFYISIQYDPIEISHNLRYNNGVIPGIRPGVPTANYLKKQMKKLAFISSIMLAIIAVIPLFLEQFIPKVNTYVSGTSILILVGVMAELYRQVHAEMLPRRSMYHNLLTTAFSKA